MLKGLLEAKLSIQHQSWTETRKAGEDQHPGRQIEEPMHLIPAGQSDPGKEQCGDGQKQHSLGTHR